MGIDANRGERELGHVGTADEHRAGALQTFDDGSIRSGRSSVIQGPGSGESDFTFDIEQILDGDRNAGNGRGRIACTSQVILGTCDRPRLIVPNPDEGAPALAFRIRNPRQAGLDEFKAARLVIEKRFALLADIG